MGIVVDFLELKESRKRVDDLEFSILDIQDLDNSPEDECDEIDNLYKEYYKDYNEYMTEVNKEIWSFEEGILKVKYQY